MATDAGEATTVAERLSDWEKIAFPDCRDEVRTGTVSRALALDVMRTAVERYYPECCYAFGHGSALDGTYQAYSDLDLIVFNAGTANWEMRHEMVDGFRVEFTTFALDTVDLMALVALQLRMPLGLLAADSEIIVDATGDAEAFRERLRALAERMPLLDRTFERGSLRAQLFSTLIDLRKGRVAEVAQAIVLTNYQAYVRAITLLHDTWQHRSRHFVKNPSLPGAAHIGDLHAAVARLMMGDVPAMITFTEELIERLGGPLWSGRVFSQEVRPDMLPVLKMLLSMQDA